MNWLVTFALGLVVGAVVGRWWALAAAVAFGALIWAKTDVEIAHWLLGTMYGGIAALGIAAGVGIRRLIKRA